MALRLDAAVGAHSVVTDADRGVASVVRSFNSFAIADNRSIWVARAVADDPVAQSFDIAIALRSAVSDTNRGHRVCRSTHQDQHREGQDHFLHENLIAKGDV